MTRHALVALVPMRHESERVPGKNYRPLGGTPLYQHIVSTLLDVPEIDRVVIDTDSPVISTGAADLSPRVTILERPENLRAGEIPMNDILIRDVELVEAEAYLQTHSTNPFLKAATISEAIRAFRTTPDRDSLFSVTRLQTRLWNDDGLPLNHDPEVLLRTQDLPAVYEENSCLYVFHRATFLQRRNRIGYRPLLFEVEAREAWDIDEESDFRIAEAMHGALHA